jgi:oxygen-dependent protoporphyrinogen oxidase
VIHSSKINGYQVEAGPNSFQAAAPALKLVEEVGLWDELLPPAPNSPRFVYREGKLRKFPFGPLSASGILRLFGEPFIRSKSSGDESVRDFFIRRIGRQAHDRLVAPALTGIYAGDTANLSMAAVFPKILEMERDHGSLLGAFVGSFRKKSQPAGVPQLRQRPKGSMFSFPDGLETLPKRLAEQLDIKYKSSDPRIGDAPATVITTPAYRAAGLVGDRNSTLAALLEKVPYAPIVIAAVSLPDHAFAAPLRGFGFLAARQPGFHLLGAIFSSALFPGRAPMGRELLTCFLGGTFEPDIIDWSDDKVWEVVCGEIQSVFRTPETPEPVALFRYTHAIPQYNIGHKRWVAAVKEELNRTPGLFVTANYMEGVSVPACIEQGERTARTVAEYLGRKP